MTTATHSSFVPRGQLEQSDQFERDVAAILGLDLNAPMRQPDRPRRRMTRRVGIAISSAIGAVALAGGAWSLSWTSLRTNLSAVANRAIAAATADAPPRSMPTALSPVTLRKPDASSTIAGDPPPNLETAGRNVPTRPVAFAATPSSPTRSVPLPPPNPALKTERVQVAIRSPVIAASAGRSSSLPTSPAIATPGRTNEAAARRPVTPPPPRRLPTLTDTSTIAVASAAASSLSTRNTPLGTVAAEGPRRTANTRPEDAAVVTVDTTQEQTARDRERRRNLDILRSLRRQ